MSEMGLNGGPGSHEEANVWYQALWIPKAADLRGDLVVLAFHAAVWVRRDGEVSRRKGS
jgi:hypothetical protein